MMGEDLSLQNMIENYEKDVLKRKSQGGNGSNNISRAASAVKCVPPQENGSTAISHSQPCLVSMVGQGDGMKREINRRQDQNIYLGINSPRRPPLCSSTDRPCLPNNTSTSTSSSNDFNPPPYQAPVLTRDNTLIRECFNLKNENNKLRKSNSNLNDKCKKLEILSREYETIEREFEILQNKSFKSEQLEKTTIRKMEEQIKTLKSENDSVKNQLENQVEQSTKMNLIIKELVAVRERQAMEIIAQNTTLEDQRKHIEMLEQAIMKAQEMLASKDRQVQDMHRSHMNLQMSIEEKVENEKTLMKEIKNLRRNTTEIDDVQKMKNTISAKEEKIGKLKRDLYQLQVTMGSHVMEGNSFEDPYQFHSPPPQYLRTQQANGLVQSLDGTNEDKIASYHKYQQLRKQQSDGRFKSLGKEPENYFHYQHELGRMPSKEVTPPEQWYHRVSESQKSPNSNYSKNLQRNLSNNGFHHATPAPNPNEIYRGHLLSNLSEQYSQPPISVVNFSSNVNLNPQQQIIPPSNSNYNSTNLSAAEYVASRRSEYGYIDSPPKNHGMSNYCDASNHESNNNNFHATNGMTSSSNSGVLKRRDSKNQGSFKSSSSSSSAPNSKTNSTVICDLNSIPNNVRRHSSTKSYGMVDSMKSNSINSMTHSKSSSEAENIDELTHENNNINLNYVSVQQNSSTNLVPKCIIVNDDI
uniref:Uncharacterized protein n=1 Tax=Rhabditophanes sp. KR3021 TaxID=114890 RepID=A0AC35UE38_9BILA